MGQWLLIVKLDVFSLQMSELGSDRRSEVLVREVCSMMGGEIENMVSFLYSETEGKQSEGVVGVKKEEYLSLFLKK